MKIELTNFQDFLENKDLKKSTITKYTYYFFCYMKFGRKFNQEIVNRFLSNRVGKGAAARGFLINFKKFLLLNYREIGLSREERLEVSEVEMPEKSGRTKERLIKPLTEEQIWKLERLFETEKDKLQLLLTFYGGLRIGELRKIQIISFNWEEWKKDMTRYGECRVYGKGDKEGIAFFPPWLMKRVAIFIKSNKFKSLSSYIFLHNVTNLENINLENKLRGWQDRLKEVGLKSGIMKKDHLGKVIEETNVHPHRLRHSFGYYLKNVKKLDIRDIQEFMRHSKITSTQRYTYVSREDLHKLLSEKFSGDQLPLQQAEAKPGSSCSEPQPEHTNTQQLEHKSDLTQ